MLFLALALCSDVICLMLLPVHWLFFAASTYVWVQFVWHTGTLNVFFYLWLRFIKRKKTFLCCGRLLLFTFPAYTAPVLHIALTRFVSLSFKDRGLGLPTISMWLLFIYVEASVRLKELKNLPFHLDLCRPFAAHW